VHGPVSIELAQQGTNEPLNRVHSLMLHNWLVYHCAGEMLSGEQVGRHYDEMLEHMAVDHRRPINMVLGELKLLLGRRGKGTRTVHNRTNEKRRRVYIIPRRRA
jgi:hypothetical protein